MKPVKDIVLDALATGKLASLATATTIAACGKAELDNPVAPLNSISHIVFGEEAIRQEKPSLKYTATGLILNDAACTSWAALHQQFFGNSTKNGNLPLSFAGGGLIAAIAYFTDYYLVPKGLTPGIERRLSRRSIALLYVVLALSLGAGSVLNAHRNKD